MTTTARVAAARAVGEAPNRRRREAAAARDAPLARAITLSAVWPGLDEGCRQVVAARAAHPAASWTEIAGWLGVSKDAAYGVWRRICRLPEVQALRAEIAKRSEED